MNILSELQRDFTMTRELILVCSLLHEGAGLLPRHSFSSTTVSLNPNLCSGAEKGESGCFSTPLEMKGLTGTQVLTFVTLAFSTVLGISLLLPNH